MRTLFTQEEIALLEKNNYTHLVSKSMIKFTDDFKDDFWRLYLTDLPVKEIFRMLGYDPEVIGTKRIDGFVYNLRKSRLTDEQRIGSISRASKVRRPPADVNYSEMKSKEAIKAMEIELTYLRQEVDFLKKLYSLIPLKTSNYADNLVQRKFREHGARKILLTDITYLPYNGTFAYLSTIIDAFTKQVLSYVLSDNLKVDFVLLTVQQLVDTHGISLSEETIIHSDQGVHYTSYKFIEIVNDAKLRQSMSRRGNCWDNAPQESFFGHMKDEIDITNCSTFDEVKAIVDDWIDYYNNERYQWGLAKLAPNEYYNYITTGIYPIK